MWIVVVVFLLGIIVGGVVNQLGSDLPRRGSPTEPHCPYCGRERPRWQWLGVLAYVTGRPQCPSCGAPVRLRRPLVEIGLGLVYGYLWITRGPSVELLFYALYSAILALVLITDLEHRLILDVVTYPAVVLGFVGSLFLPDVTWWSALIGGAIGLGFFFLVALIGHAVFGAGALGGGDVKLAAFVGIITGFPLVIEAIVLTILIGAVISLLLLITGLRSLRDHVPYGPFLVAGAVVTLLWGYRIAEWFLT
jgi:leader peptidase (prepilin peptidase)/N-methyltransferase